MAKPFESRIQDLVYNVDVGIGLRLIKLCLYALFVLIVMLLFTAMQFKGLKDAEAMDYAQLGRNLALQKKLVTQCVRPASMWYLIENRRYDDSMIMRHPDILNAPLYPALLATGFKLFKTPFPDESSARNFPAEKWVILPFNHFFSILTGILVFLLGCKLFDRRVAWLGMTSYYLSYTVWFDSISGLGISVLTFLTTLAIYMLVIAAGRAREEKARLRSWIVPFVVAALCCIAAFLTRYAAAALVPAFALFIVLSFGKKGWVWALVFAGVFVAGILPWLARNVIVSGGLLGLAPYHALYDSILFSGDSFYRTLAPVFSFKGVFNAIRTKWMLGFASFYKTDLLSIGDGILICLFITAFFYHFVRERVHLLRWSIALGIVLMGCIGAVYGKQTIRLLNIFWPVVLLYGLAFFFLMLDRLQLRIRILNYGLIGAIMLLTALPLIFAMLPPRGGSPYPPYFPPYIMHVCNFLEPGELLCSDMPWATAWYGKRNTLQLPMTIDEFYTINDYNKRVSGIYFTDITRNKPYVRDLFKGPEQTWFPILEGRIPADFPLTQGFPIGNMMNQLFLTDRARWAE
ncbi:MAG: hypothetical protein EOM20_13020 [Spartobacteria bacterium]|nr:hypothetical protein [Spartobacteria bacterium]